MTPKSESVALNFRNSGKAGVVFHVYDKLHLERISRCYTVESGKQLTDYWQTAENDARYDLWVYGPNGFVREFRGKAHASPIEELPNVRLEYDTPNGAVQVIAVNRTHRQVALEIRANAYGSSTPQIVKLPPEGTRLVSRSVVASHNWYDFTVAGDTFEQRFAGRMESGQHTYTDPAS